jgi:hypothetical protein
MSWTRPIRRVAPNEVATGQFCFRPSLHLHFTTICGIRHGGERKAPSPDAYNRCSGETLLWWDRVNMLCIEKATNRVTLEYTTPVRKQKEGDLGYGKKQSIQHCRAH